MPTPRSSRKKPTTVREKTQAFHLGKKAKMGASGAVVGAIVAGPIGALLGGALGTAFGAAAIAKEVPKTTTMKTKAKTSAASDAKPDSASSRSPRPSRTRRTVAQKASTKGATARSGKRRRARA